jgi:hypothetical protein
VSLRKSPTLTPALLAANRANAGKSTGPRTARGKAISRLNHMQHGMRSPEYINFFQTVMQTPHPRLVTTAVALLSSLPVIHPLFMEMVEMVIDADYANEKPHRRREKQREFRENLFFRRSKPEGY